MATKTNTTVKSKKGKQYKYARITRVIGHEWKDGKKIPVTKQFTGTSKTAAEKKYEDWKESQRNRKERHVLDSSKTTAELMDFFAKNVLAVSSDFANSTKVQYLGAYKQFKEKDETGLLAMEIQDVTSSHIQVAYNKLQVPGSTMQSINKFFTHFFKWAALNQYCGYVLMPVTIPKKPIVKKKDGIVVWDDEEFKMITRALYQYEKDHGQNHRLRFMVFLGAYTGMRISEMFGIKYTDITDTVSIRRQFYRGDLTGPKYGSSREVPTHPVIMDELKIHRAWHNKEMQQNGYETDFVFTTPKGTFLDYANVRKDLAKLYRVYDVPYKAPHTYRATFCTNLCKQGVPLEVASKLMGHKSIEVTAEYYALVDDKSKLNAINKLPGIESVKNL